MEALNGCEPRKITVKGPYTFSIGDTSSLGNYISGGIFTQVKMPKVLAFVSIVFLLRYRMVLTVHSLFFRNHFVNRSDLPKFLLPILRSLTDHLLYMLDFRHLRLLNYSTDVCLALATHQTPRS